MFTVPEGHSAFTLLGKPKGTQPRPLIIGPISTYCKVVEEIELSRVEGRWFIVFKMLLKM